MNPIIFETRFFTIYSLWLFFAIAILVGTYLLIKLAIRQGLKLQFLSENALVLFLSAIVFARIFHIIIKYASYFYEFSPEAILRLFYFWDQGLSFWGAAVGFIIYFYWICKKNEQSFLKWLDVLVPAVIGGIAISNIGEFFDGSSYGIPTHLPWGVNFENPAIKYAVAIHPTQIYAFLYSTLITTILVLLLNTEKIKTMEKPGFIGFLGLIAYYFLRFLEEFVRGDDTYTIFSIRLTQIIIFTIFTTLSIFFYLRYFGPKRQQRKVKKTPPSLH